MKRYKLKKDLPTFKAGEEFRLAENGNLIREGNATLDYVVAYSRGTLENFPNILADWFEEIPERPKTVWDLKKGDECWIVRCSDCSAPYAGRYAWHGDDMLRHFRDMGELFLTEQEAERHIERSKARAILMRDTKGFKVGKNNGRFYFIRYDIYDDDFDVDYWSSDNSGTYISSPINFATEEDAKESIDKHRREWLIYLGVKNSDETE